MSLQEEVLLFLKSIKSDLVSNGIKNIGLFGSLAKNKNTKNSDIDIVYETTDKFINKYKGWNAFTYLNDNLREKVKNKFNIDVDMFDLNSSSSIREKVKKEALYV